MIEIMKEYERAINYPYDGIHEEYSKERLIALAILADLTDRRGIKYELNSIDDDIKIELVESLEKIIKYGIEEL